MADLVWPALASPGPGGVLLLALMLRRGLARVLGADHGDIEGVEAGHVRFLVHLIALKRDLKLAPHLKGLLALIVLEGEEELVAVPVVAARLLEPLLREGAHEAAVLALRGEVKREDIGLSALHQVGAGLAGVHRQHGPADRCDERAAQA